MRTLNRSAIVVTPKEPFLDWIRGVDPLNRELTMTELESWDRVQESWPKDRSFAVFLRWFDYSIHSMTFDLADQRLELEEM